MIDAGKVLEVNFTVDDPDAFHEPWSAIQRYGRVQQPLREDICAENNQHLFDYHIPVADKPDFYTPVEGRWETKVDLRG